MAKTSFISTDAAWAEVSNTPYSGYKTLTTEGGICTPLIISGKGFNSGTIDTENLLHVTDIFPTILEYTNTTFPSNKKLAPLYGKSMITDSAVRGEDDALCFEILEGKAVIKGDWKALFLTKPYGDGETWKLYHLKSDLLEKNDLASKHPDILKELVTEWNEYAISVGYIKPDDSIFKFGHEIGHDKFYEYDPKYKMD